MIKINENTIAVGLFERAHQCLMINEPKLKVQQIYHLFQDILEGKWRFDIAYPIDPDVVAGYPAALNLVSPKDLPRRRLHSPKGRAAMLHALLHIEFNAMNLALDAITRFRNMPEQYYFDWLTVACEEAYHFHLLSEHAQSVGCRYGDFPAHNGLWEMAQKTAYDVMVRMALVPRLLEARGLDAVPELARRFNHADDSLSSEILGIIFQDEIGHVQVGNRWYYYLCEQRGQEPLSVFLSLLKKHAPDFLKGPFAEEVRRKAGFRENELEVLNHIDEALERL